MTSDETYLESYLESISTLPSEIRRNLGLLKSLDQSCAARTKELRDSEEAYLLQALEIVQAIPVGSKPLTVDCDGDGDGDGSGGEGSDSEPPRSKKRKLKEGDDVATASNSTSKNNQQEDDKSGSDESVSKLPTNIWAQQPQKGAIVEKDGKRIRVVPTTQELRSQIENPQALRTIATLRRQTRDYIAEKLAVASQTYSIVNEAIKRIDTDLETFEGLLKGTGQFETVVVGAQPDSLAAIQVMPNSQDWILAKVISHDTHSGMYKLSDEDIESSKTFTLPESQVVILGGVDRLAKSDVIYAVYPDTTSFYQATVVKAPQRVSGGDSFVMVNFKDDGDEHGITHDKAVLMQHIMRVPYGAIQ